MMPASSTMSKESASYDMAEFDQSAIFLYLDGHDQEQRQTLNIFPSQPMHVAEPIPAKDVSVGMVAAMPNGNSSPPKRQEQGGQRSPAVPPAPTVALLTSAKETKSSLTKKEATNGGKGATSGDQERVRDPKTLRRLAQNREAARKSRLRKKAYIQQLETSRIRLSQLEQQVQVARVQGVFLGTGEQPGFPSAPSPAAVVFDMEYGRWVEEHSKLIFQLRAALNEHLADEQLQGFVNGAMAQHEELLNLKGALARADVFHLLSGVWASPAERCFLWLGGFCPSEVIKVMLKHVEPLSEGQILGIYNLQQTVQEREEALNHSMEATQQSISDIIAAPDVAPATFMGHMSLAMNKVSSMEGFVMQADGLRQQTLHKLHHILTTRQAARCMVAIADYFHRLRALSTLWDARPRQEDGLAL
ncbi:transcription factor TGAL7-like isoform X1 [Panicum virgatum]|uniref:transcription factor TGAL7-like isoform X1 n=2 Tax=Panicum virgatum TaxID=38727 RepID=UPI0019D548BD|nr:transcription factor TGAL7-like isoform X1 [Panicum virgatum]